MSILSKVITTVFGKKSDKDLKKLSPIIGQINDVYVKYHSIWHCCVFSTAGIVNLLRYKLDEHLYPSVRGREQITSVDSMQDVEMTGI